MAVRKLAFVLRLRLILATPLIALSACATADVASRAEVTELRNELRAERARASRMERRLELLETQRAISGSSAAAAYGDSVEVPTLAVVKLKPKLEPAPRLDTRTSVVEPSLDVVETLRTVAEERDADEPAEDPVLVDAEYEQSVRAISVGNVAGGAERLESFAQRHPRHPQADNALYNAGLAHFGLGEFDVAAQRFERVEREYPAGDAVAEAMLRLAECRMRLNRPADAKALYTQVAKTFPGTPAASQAQARLASIKP